MTDTPNGERCGEETPNPLGNRQGFCVCILPLGHDGDHECQAREPHHWPFRPPCGVGVVHPGGQPAAWRDAFTGMVVCDRHRAQYDERRSDLGPFRWEPLAVSGPL